MNTPHSGVAHFPSFTSRLARCCTFAGALAVAFVTSPVVRAQASAVSPSSSSAAIAAGNVTTGNSTIGNSTAAGKGTVSLGDLVNFDQEIPNVDRQQALADGSMPVVPPLKKIPDQTGPIGSKAWWKGPYAFGDFAGLRPALEDQGVDLGLTYLSNLAGNPYGGQRQGFTNTGSTGLNLDLDLEKIAGLQGWDFYSTAVWRYGESLTLQYLKNQFNVQQNFGGQNMRLYSAYLQKQWYNDHYLIKFGRFGAGDDFLSSPIYWLYMSNAIDGNPVSVFFNVPWTAYPNGTWAFFTRAKPVRDWYVQAGVYEGQTAYQTRMAAHGVDLSFVTGRGVNVNVQGGYTPNSEKGATGLPGHYSVGAYLTTGPYQLLAEPSRTVQNNYGFYVMLDQMIYRPGKPGSPEGLTPWFVAEIAPKSDRSQMPYFFAGGAVYQGLIPGRKNDVTAVGVVYGKYSGQLTGPQRNSYEAMVETNYKIQVNKWFFVQPDLQYILNTAGGLYPDALVLGAQVGMTF